MSSKVLVVGHADADGHLIAEQTRRNLSRVPGFEVEMFVDPAVTLNHSAWLHLDQIPWPDEYDRVFFVDLMFASGTLTQESDALLSFVRAHASTHFYLMDHHPLPERRLNVPNLHAVYRKDVLDCAFGPSSTNLMILAALCDPQASRAKSRKARAHISADYVTGMKRAAAINSPIAGAKLSALVRAARWSEIAALGAEPSALNPMPRGRRPKNAPESEALAHLNEIATRLLSHPEEQDQTLGQSSPGGSPMSYESDSTMPSADPGGAIFAPARPAVQGRDLETIVTLLELAALELTPTPEATFTRQQLLDLAREIGGPEVEMDEQDLKRVLGKNSFLKKVGDKFRLK